MQALPPTPQRHKHEMMPPGFAETSVMCLLPVNAGSGADTAATQARDDAAKFCRNNSD